MFKGAACSRAGGRRPGPHSLQPRVSRQCRKVDLGLTSGPTASAGLSGRFHEQSFTLWKSMRLREVVGRRFVLEHLP